LSTPILNAEKYPHIHFERMNPKEMGRGLEKKMDRAGWSGGVKRFSWRDLRLGWIPAFCGNDGVVEMAVSWE